MNRYIKKTICVIALLLTILIVYLIYFISTLSFYESKAPSDTAVWKGAPDCGFWYDVVSVDSIHHVARIKIYHDYDTCLEIDKYYYDKENKINPFTRLNILNSIFDFDINTGYIILWDNDSLRFKH